MARDKPGPDKQTWKRRPVIHNDLNKPQWGVRFRNMAPSAKSTILLVFQLENMRLVGMGGANRSGSPGGETLEFRGPWPSGGQAAFREAGVRPIFLQLPGVGLHSTGRSTNPSTKMIRASRGNTVVVDKQVLAAYLFPMPTASLSSNAQNSRVEISRGGFVSSSLNGQDTIDLEQTNANRVVLHLGSIQLATPRQPRSAARKVHIDLVEREEIIQTLTQFESTLQSPFVPGGPHLQDLLAQVRNHANLTVPQNAGESASSTLIHEYSCRLASLNNHTTYSEGGDFIPYLLEYYGLSEQPPPPIEQLVENNDARLLADRARLQELVSDDMAAFDRPQRRSGRREQRILRRIIIGLPEEFPVVACGICQRILPNRGDFMRCAHIRPRNTLESAEQLIDERNVVPMCTFGCDALFETGCIVVDGTGTIQPNQGSQFIVESVEDEVALRTGTNCVFHNDESEPFFRYHRESHGFTTN